MVSIHSLLTFTVFIKSAILPDHVSWSEVETGGWKWKEHDGQICSLLFVTYVNCDKNLKPRSRSFHETSLIAWRFCMTFYDNIWSGFLGTNFFGLTCIRTVRVWKTKQMQCCKHFRCYCITKTVEKLEWEKSREWEAKVTALFWVFSLLSM